MYFSIWLGCIVVAVCIVVSVDSSMCVSVCVFLQNTDVHALAKVQSYVLAT